VGVLVRPFLARDAGPVADVLFVAATERARQAGRSGAFEVPAAARRLVERLLEVDPMGAHVVDADGEVVGVGWTHARGRIATLGPLALLPRQRGQGLGRRLLETCVAAVGERGVQVRVVEDGTDAAALGCFLRAGFRIVTSLVELERPLSAGTTPPVIGAGLAIRTAGAGDEAELAARDARSWGAARPQDVAVLVAHGTAAVLVRHERMLAHAFARRGERAVWLGPAAGDDGALVGALLGHLAAEVARAEQLPARALVPAGDRRFVDALLAAGFRVRGTLEYLAGGGGTVPPPGYALCSRQLV
jgi:ribosomal protein S18 acetylase RimI-like enzyme